MAKHALLSASGAHRWLLCTPSAQLEQKFPASTSAYAEEGTVAHALAELTTRYFLGELDEVAYENQIKSEFEPNSYYNAEMRECAVAYAKFVTGRLAEAKKTCPDAMIILETRLDFSKYVPGGFGTGDCVIIAEPILDVIDFKYGKGHRVEAEDNPQMQLYGLGALEQFGDLYEIKTVRTRSPIRLAISANTAANFTVACKIIPRRRTGLPMPPPAYGKLLPTLPKSGRLGLSHKARMTPTPRVQRSLTLISTGPLTWTTTSGSLAFMAGRR